ncbi:unnamed protein product [Nezara viridula]|uniref:Ig-like domain-containing protein n=1 Tax=Nezara viridula TaxID=85310 RepID=A0A9P0HC67_NEZVI|nr:unnamed protein product [Nezara viridula]
MRNVKVFWDQLILTDHTILHNSSDILIIDKVKPLEVKIQDSNQPLSAGRLYNLPCTSTGSRPPAQLTWWKGDHRLDKTKETVSIH